MKKLLLRADDLGYSRGINYGIKDVIDKGLVRSVGVMVNMPDTLHGIELLKNANVAYGLHTNICAGYPLTDPSNIPSLVNETGRFKSSRTYREASKDFVVLEEAILEIEAQYLKFVELFGKNPDYFEGHAVASDNFFKALKIVAEKYQLKYSGLPDKNREIQVGKSIVHVTMDSMFPNYNPCKTVERMVQSAEISVVEMGIFHPGYLDYDIMSQSSLLEARTLEVRDLTSSYLINYLKESNVELIDYREL